MSFNEIKEKIAEAERQDALYKFLLAVNEEGDNLLAQVVKSANNAAAFTEETAKTINYLLKKSFEAHCLHKVLFNINKEGKTVMTMAKGRSRILSLFQNVIQTSSLSMQMDSMISLAQSLLGQHREA